GVTGSSTTSPRRSCTFALHRSSSISFPRPIARRTISLRRSRRIPRPHGLSHITSPPLAISHRHRSPSTTTRRTSLFARGHSGLRGIAVRPPAAHHPISTTRNALISVGFSVGFFPALIPSDFPRTFRRINAWESLTNMFASGWDIRRKIRR
ncbi:hypothetical protein PIB30_111466, partial [Stylosanthes scabra]|nr:hypothetical protein [Stylosanthes scabra]